MIVTPIVQSFIFYSTLLVVKMLPLTVMTVRRRVAKGVFANMEDAQMVNGKVKFDDPDVERIRRVHLNDVENIPLFWVLGALYLTTDPVEAWARLLFRIFAICRILHTIVYLYVPHPQISRPIVFFVGYFVQWYMAFQILSHYVTAM